jgi:hypothetical protein
MSGMPRSAITMPYRSGPASKFRSASNALK